MIFFWPPPIQKFQYFIDQSTCMFAHIWETDPSTFQLAKCRIFKIQTIPSGILNYISEGRLTKKSSVFITCIDGEKQKKANTFFTRKSSLVRETHCCEYNSTVLRGVYISSCCVNTITVRKPPIFLNKTRDLYLSFKTKFFEFGALEVVAICP